MYYSREIRWFFRAEKKHISQWFASKGLTFENIEPRSDYYLPIPGREDMNVKLREGNIEIKQRRGIPEVGTLTEHTKGLFDNWVKWSFKIDKDDWLSQSIIEEKKYNWIEVYKERIGIKLAKDRKGKTIILNLNDRIPYGCQVEYTHVRLKGQEWFTFGLEWFGDKLLELNQSLLLEILGQTIFREEESMGYAGFLSELDLKY